MQATKAIRFLFSFLFLVGRYLDVEIFFLILSGLSLELIKLFLINGFTHVTPSLHKICNYTANTYPLFIDHSSMFFKQFTQLLTEKYFWYGCSDTSNDLKNHYNYPYSSIVTYDHSIKRALWNPRTSIHKNRLTVIILTPSSSIWSIAWHAMNVLTTEPHNPSLYVLQTMLLYDNNYPRFWLDNTIFHSPYQNVIITYQKCSQG